MNKLKVAAFFLLLIAGLTEAHAAGLMQVCFGDRCLTAEVAGDEASRVRGLQKRSELGESAGMLFIFEKEGQYNFWMKDTLIPLDMIWMDSQQNIVDIKEQVPPCRKDPCPVYAPSGPAMYVLEANAGFAKKAEIKIGDKVELK